MVRETRHLWVGNLPDNIREDRIREHFKRYGRVQNVKLLGRTENPSAVTSGTASSGVCATVAFMDIKSASKAHNAEHVLDERTLTTEYYEPTAIPSVAGAPSAGSSPAGSGYSGSSSSVNSAPATTASVSRYHLSGGEDSASAQCAIAATAAAPVTWRGTNDSATEFCRRGSTPATYGRYQRNNSTSAPYATPPSNTERCGGGGTTRWYGGSGGGGESTPSTPGGAEPARRRRRSGSGSSRSDSSSPDASDASRASTPQAPPPTQPSANHRTPTSSHHQWSSSTASGRPLAICVRNLPTRSTDSSLKDGLYHEYKKHGKVVWVKIVGQNADRYAVVRFKKPSDVEKALEVSQDKLFFGCKISVAPHQSCDDDADSVKPYETDIDEYHPKATRTLFIGNLEKDVTQQQIRDKFKHFGRIIEVDIKKGSGGGAGYAFCQYASISSVVDAIRAMDGEYVGGARVKLGFGKPVATTCVWVDGLTEHTEKQVLGAVGRCGTALSVCVDRAAGAALVHFEQAAAAGACVRELRRVAASTASAEPAHPRLTVDYASRECQEAFYEQLEKHGGGTTTTTPGDRAADARLPRLDTLRYEGGSRSRASSYGRGASRTPRYGTLEHYDSADYSDRRYRVYEELGSSPATEDIAYEERLQSVVVSPQRARRHRRDSTPDDRKLSKERHRSGARRSRSGSMCGSRHGRRRHRRRRESGSPRAGTPLRDEPEGAPAEPRRPPRERPPLPMCLPLPKFAAQLLRQRPPTPRPAPDSPPRPPSAASSSSGSAPHSPSLEERIRSLDEKYERWSGSRAANDAPDRARLRHRLLDVDIHEVKPSDVVRSLLAKRSVFDEDSERLEGCPRAAAAAAAAALDPRRDPARRRRLLPDAPDNDDNAADDPTRCLKLLDEPFRLTTLKAFDDPSRMQPSKSLDEPSRTPTSKSFDEPSRTPTSKSFDEPSRPMLLKSFDDPSRIPVSKAFDDLPRSSSQKMLDETLKQGQGSRLHEEPSRTPSQKALDDQSRSVESRSSNQRLLDELPKSSNQRTPDESLRVCNQRVTEELSRSTSQRILDETNRTTSQRVYDDPNKIPRQKTNDESSSRLSRPRTPEKSVRSSRQRSPEELSKLSSQKSIDDSCKVQCPRIQSELNKVARPTTPEELPKPMRQRTPEEPPPPIVQTSIEEQIRCPSQRIIDEISKTSQKLAEDASRNPNQKVSDELVRSSRLLDETVSQKTIDDSSRLINQRIHDESHRPSRTEELSRPSSRRPSDELHRSSSQKVIEEISRPTKEESTVRTPIQRKSDDTTKSSIQRFTDEISRFKTSDTSRLFNHRLSEEVTRASSLKLLDGRRLSVELIPLPTTSRRNSIKTEDKDPELPQKPSNENISRNETKNVFDTKEDFKVETETIVKNEKKNNRRRSDSIEFKHKGDYENKTSKLLVKQEKDVKVNHENFLSNHISKDFIKSEEIYNHSELVIGKSSTDFLNINHDSAKIDKPKYEEPKSIIMSNIKVEKDDIEYEKPSVKNNQITNSNSLSSNKILLDMEKSIDDRIRHDRERSLDERSKNDRERSMDERPKNDRERLLDERSKNDRERSMDERPKNDRERLLDERSKNDRERSMDERPKNDRERSLDERPKNDRERTLDERPKNDRDRSLDERSKNDRERTKHSKDRIDRDKTEKDRHEHQHKHEEKIKASKHEKPADRHERDKRSKDEHSTDRSRSEKDSDKSHKEKHETDKVKHSEEKSKYELHKRHSIEKSEKDKKKENGEFDKSKKEDKHKHERSKKESTDTKRDKKEGEGSKSRKSSRDESIKEFNRKDSTDSSASRTSHDSIKAKDSENIEPKDESRHKIIPIDLFQKLDNEKDQSKSKSKVESKDDRSSEQQLKIKNDNTDLSHKSRSDVSEKQRHHSLDSPQVDAKRKERLNSSSSLPSHIGHKRRMSSQDSLESICEQAKKSRNENKIPERRESKDSRNNDRHKVPKFSKGHFAKLIESKTKDEKKNQVKPPDDSFIELKNCDVKDQKTFEKCKPPKKITKEEFDERNSHVSSSSAPQVSQNDLDFLATLELRSSEEDEKQKALRKDMKEKKRIQQLQQIQELQMQQDAMHQAELLNKSKDDKKQKGDDKKKELAREKRMSTDRKSRDEKIEHKRKNSKKQSGSTDSSDTDEPKKHSIFDIVDDGPTYISMYDKVKARSCKNMQKQEEEKRQEKIKAKFSQLKQSRAKREEKKRSSWDEDSDSETDRRMHHKTSVESSTEDEDMHNKNRDKPHRSSEFRRNKTSGYVSTEEDACNKLSRKNSRTRIMSDSSDDDASKRSISPSFLNDHKKDLSDFETIPKKKDEDTPPTKTFIDDKIKKNSLLNLFGKSDSDDSRLKSSIETDTDYNTHFNKLNNHDLSSESESMPSRRNSSDMRKKHKKKQKKFKFSLSDEETRNETSEPITNDNKHKHDKMRRSSSKKEKRREKAHESGTMSNLHEEKAHFKKEKISPITSSYDQTTESALKKEGKMEDIFGPISDESDRETRRIHAKNDFQNHEYDSTFSTSDICFVPTSEDNKLKDKEDNRRKKEKRRKERKHFFREDDNSLDVDAVSKAIEARLFAETVDSHIKHEKSDHKHGKHDDGNPLEFSKMNKYNERVKEKKKKKKRNKEDKQSRKDHHHSHHREQQLSKSESQTIEDWNLGLSPKSLILEDIPLPTEPHIVHLSDKSDDCKSLCESPSLPRLVESPPIVIQSDSQNTDIKDMDSDTISQIIIDESDDTDLTRKTDTEDVPTPYSLENFVPDISEVPLPDGPMPEKVSENRHKPEVNSFDMDCNENAVRSITNLQEDEDKTKPIEKPDSPKIEKKAEEKPRAVISQEETEDAVAALLGESFGGKDSSFDTCFEEIDNSPTIQTDSENTTVETENILEEDAEEMRRAVQNLNACEMEMKPDTPVSDSDLLLIDTDSEETDETPLESSEKVPVNVITTSQAQTSTAEAPKPIEVKNIIVAKPKTTIAQPIISEPSVSISVSTPIPEKETKVVTPPKEPVQYITSTATPVITSWTLTSNNKIIEPHILNIQANQLSHRDGHETKPGHITANIVQIKAPSKPIVRPIITPYRVTAPYQVLNHMMRPQNSNMQPPTIKIPESHILYQKPGIVISPRVAPSDPRMQSPKASPHSEGMTSPRLTILTSSPQSVSCVAGAVVAPGGGGGGPARSPGQVTVVRMPLSPLQLGARALASPTRPPSVLVQAPPDALHYARLPAAPLPPAAPRPLSAVVTAAAAPLPSNNVTITTSPLTHQQKHLVAEPHKPDYPQEPDKITDAAKIMLSPTGLSRLTNPTVLAQNRLISMQNSVNLGNIHLTGSKVLINKIGQIAEKRDMQVQKSEHVPFAPTPIIHVTGVASSSGSIIHTSGKPITCSLQDGSTALRGTTPNVIHALNTQRLITATSLSNILQIDANKTPPSVLSMTTIRSPTVLTKIESSTSTSVTTPSLTNVVMTPLLLKTSPSPATIRIKPKNLAEKMEEASIHKEFIEQPEKPIDLKDNVKLKVDLKEEQNIKPVETTLTPAQEHKIKCETDFEELLKDTTNEIKVTNDPDKKLEINVGKTVTVLTNHENKSSMESVKKENSPEAATPSVSSAFITVNSPTITQVKKDPLTPERSENTLQNIDFVSKKELAICKTENKPEVHQQTDNKPPSKTDENEQSLIMPLLKDLNSLPDDRLKSLDDDSWSAKDINIESVIKKVDSLCNDNIDIVDSKEDKPKAVSTEERRSSVTQTQVTSFTKDPENTAMDVEHDNITCGFGVIKTTGQNTITTPSKRGGRSTRGKRSEKKQERVQTRQIAKPGRGGAGRRGRGRAKLDKKIKSVSENSHNIPGDVYDFHEDSGDESASKTEARPRLILTIKSPLSGQSNVVASSTLSIAQKEKLEKSNACKDDKVEDFVSPSTNTRKSRRLQEKDVQKTVMDDSADEGKPATRGGGRRRSTRGGARGASDKSSSGSDTRKSPRGVKRSRGRSMSDASLDSGEDRPLKPDDAAKDAKQPKLDDQSAATTVSPVASVAPLEVRPEPRLPSPKPVPVLTKPAAALPKAVVLPPAPALAAALPAAVSTPVPVVVAAPPQPSSTPIMKPPKKMISEISAKLASAAAAGAAAGAEAAGASDAADARVHSPALPHRPPSAHRLADRATPLLIRGAETEPVARAPYAATASLPRGAHQPHAHKQVAVVGPHHHHPGAASRVTITSVPAISPQGQMALGDGMYRHFSHQHYQMYQQHFRATQHESRATPTPYTRTLEAEGSEAPTPPLELRRPPPSARVPRPAHSPAPADRLIMYAVGCGRSPPPAHGLARGALPPGAAPGPPHASQVPREADSLHSLLTRYPVMWQGLLALKNDAAAVQMHFVGGNPSVAGDTLPRHTDGSTPPLRIAQRMRLEPPQLDQVQRKMKLEHEHCILLALPCGRDHMDVLQQSKNLSHGFITYLQRKQAAGIVNVAPPGHHQAMYTVHIFPTCEFANENLNRFAPDLMHRVADIAHLLIVIATV